MFEYDRNKDEIKEAAIDWKKQHGLPKNVFAMSTCISKRVKWLMDTGCGHDLIGRAKAKSLGVDIVKDDDEIVFQTANGSTSTSDVAKIVVDELDETVEPHVLDETPTVLSIGRRCMKMGYAFHWMPGKLPFMVTPKQGFVHLQVKDDIPYLVSDGKLRSNRRRPTIDDLKEHFSEVLALVTNAEADQDGDGDDDVIPAAAGESAEVEGDHHHGAFLWLRKYQTLGQSHVVMVMPKLTRKRLMKMIQMLESKLMCTKGHRSKGKWESSRGTPTPLLTCLPTGIETPSVNHASRRR